MSGFNWRKERLLNCRVKKMLTWGPVEAEQGFFFLLLLRNRAGTPFDNYILPPKMQKTISYSSTPNLWEHVGMKYAKMCTAFTS